MFSLKESPQKERVINPEFPRVSRRESAKTAVVSIGSTPFGGDAFQVIAGPCAVESEEIISSAARMVASMGARVLRGGAFKPRTSPYSFQGLGMEGVHLLRKAALAAGIPFVTEVLAPEWVEKMAPHVDAFQIGARNMHNFDLLREVGKSGRPVLLKRSFGATVKEWVFAAEYIANEGNEDIILCERGIRSFDQATRFTLDIAGAMWAKHETRLPVIIDPSHAIGLPHLIGGAVAATAAAGLDGVIVEVHPNPAIARCDGDQALTVADFEALMARLRPIAEAMGRSLESGTP